jgi:drug/metabolite transporter (DMT)-like permease
MSSPALQQFSLHHKGVLLVLISAIIWSTAGLFTKSVSADVWTILFWRSVFSAVFILGYVGWKQGRRLGADFQRLGVPGWSLAVIGAAATVCFIAAFKQTSVANVGIVYATIPFLAAGLGWVLIREVPGRATMVAATAALAGVCIMLGGSVGSPNLSGDGLALLMTFGMACVVVLVRKYPDLPMVLANAMSAVLLLVVAPLVSEPFQISTHDLVWLIGFGSVFAIAVILLTEGSRLIPASQSALVGTLEGPLAPVWAWMWLNEVPPLATWIGGVVVFTAVIWNMRRGEG